MQRMHTHELVHTSISRLRCARHHRMWFQFSGNLLNKSEVTLLNFDPSKSDM
jgi:hypothetical protein